MKIYLYGQSEGLSITKLPLEKEGQMIVYHTDHDGRTERLLDIEGNGMEWIAYATPNGRIEREGKPVDELTLIDCLYFTVLTQGKRLRVLCCEQLDNQRDAVHLFRLPPNKTLTVGSGECDIQCAHPMLRACEMEFCKEGQAIRFKASSPGSEIYLNNCWAESGSIASCNRLDLFGLRILFADEMIAVIAHGVQLQVSDQLRPVFFRRTETKESVCNRHMLSINVKAYNRSPRIAKPEGQEEITIEAPPAPVEKEETPLVFSIGSSAFMSISSVMMAMNSVSSAQAANAPITTVLPTVVMAGGMFFGSLLMPMITRRYADKMAVRKEEERKNKYRAYLQRAEKRLNTIAENEKNELLKTYREPSVLLDEVTGYKDSLWSTLWTHMPFHNDFLSLRLGTAKLEPTAKVEYPKQSFSVDEDELRNELEQMKKRPHSINQMPLMLSLRKEGIIGIIADYQERMDYLKGLLVQLCTHHSYQEMKLVFVYDKAEEEAWEFARWLPHVWNDSGEFRAIGTERDAMRNISAYIDALCPINDRESDADQMCVVVLASNYLQEQCYALTERMKHISRCNMRVIAIAAEENDLPKECNSVIVLQGSRGALYQDIGKMTHPVVFDLDPIPKEQIRSFTSKLSNIRLNDSQSDGKLADMITFFDMLRCGNVEQINAPERWKNANPVKTLAAPVGIDKYGALMSLDIHQNAHGPHGLIAGMTGSGKSEFIISYLLSMAINYSPLEVGFILIDYKGGGMSDTLAGLPHVLGVIDNLGGSQGIHRALISIKSEVMRRQLLFKEIGEAKHVSNLDIYKYQAMYRNGEIDKPLQHLIIVSDEFAELKEQEGSFMDDIVSIARIGRSLGVHLILATQKPTGVVSPQIASNARFHVCLKVQDRSDSMEMLGRTEAALLTKTGRFYLQVGFNEVFVLGQSAWSGAVLVPKPRYVEEPDTSFEMLNDLGETVARSHPSSVVKSAESTKQVDAVVKYLNETAQRLGMMPEKSWKPALKPHVTLDEIDASFKPVYACYQLDPVIGIVDDPKHQRQYPLQLDFVNKGNAIVYGFTGAGKQEVINAVIYSLCMHHTADELNIYCLDFASETCRMFDAMPHVGDVVVAGEDEKVANLISMLTDEMNSRRKILSAFGGNIALYRNEKDVHMPNILVVISNYTGFSETYESLDDSVYRLIREGNRFGIYFIITCMSSTGIRYRLTQNFKQVLCLQMTDKMDYANILGKTDGVEPMTRLGSGIRSDDGIVEFQTGFIYPEDVRDCYKRTQDLSVETAMQWKGEKASRVPILPEHVSIRDLCDTPVGITMKAVPIGIERESMKICSRSFADSYLNLLLYSNLPEIPYFQLLGELISRNEERQVIMLDAGKLLEHGLHPAYKLASNDAEAAETIADLFNMTVQRHNETKAADLAGAKRPLYPETVIMIADVKGLFDRLKENELAYAQLDAVLKMGRCDLNMFVLLLQESRFVAAMTMHEWYASLPNRDGIWLGDGITMQSVLKTDITRRDASMSEQFGYNVQRGKARMIKLLEER